MAAVRQAENDKNNLKREFARLILGLGLTAAVLAGCGDTNTAAETNPDLPGARTTAPTVETQYSDSEVADRSDGVIAIRDEDINQDIAEVNFYGDSEYLDTIEFSNLGGAESQELVEYTSDVLINFAEGQAEILSNLDDVHVAEDEAGGKTFSSNNPEAIDGGEAFMQITSIPGISGRSEAGSDIEMLPALKFSAQSGGEGFDMLLEHNSNKKVDSPEDAKDILENAQENKVKFSSLEQSSGTDVYNDDEEGMYGFDARGDKSKNPLVFRSGINSAYNTLSSVQEEFANPEAPRQWENLNFEEKVNIAGIDTVLDALRVYEEGEYKFGEDETKDWPEGSPGSEGFLVRGLDKDDPNSMLREDKEIAIHQDLDNHLINVAAKYIDPETNDAYHSWSISVRYPENSEFSNYDSVEDIDKIISAIEAMAYKQNSELDLEVGAVNIDVAGSAIYSYGNFEEEPEFSVEDPYTSNHREQFLEDLFRMKEDYGLGGNKDSHKQIS